MHKLRQQQYAFSQDIAKLIAWVNEGGRGCAIGNAYVAAPGTNDSNAHAQRLAMDLDLFEDDGPYSLSDAKSYAEYGTYWERLHPQNKWGGRNGKNHNHFERTLL